MIKVKSVIDVITNSSTEVFIIKSELSSDEIDNIIYKVARELYCESAIEPSELLNDEKYSRPVKEKKYRIEIEDWADDLIEFIEDNFKIEDHKHW